MGKISGWRLSNRVAYKKVCSGIIKMWWLNECRPAVYIGCSWQSFSCVLCSFFCNSKEFRIGRLNLKKKIKTCWAPCNVIITIAVSIVVTSRSLHNDVKYSRALWRSFEYISTKRNTTYTHNTAWMVEQSWWKSEMKITLPVKNNSA